MPGHDQVAGGVVPLLHDGTQDWPPPSTFFSERSPMPVIAGELTYEKLSYGSKYFFFDRKGESIASEDPTSLCSAVLGREVIVGGKISFSISFFQLTEAKKGCLLTSSASFVLPRRLLSYSVQSRCGSRYIFAQQLLQQVLR